MKSSSPTTRLRHQGTQCPLFFLFHLWWQISSKMYLPGFFCLCRKWWVWLTGFRIWCVQMNFEWAMCAYGWILTGVVFCSKMLDISFLEVVENQEKYQVFPKRFDSLFRMRRVKVFVNCIWKANLGLEGLVIFFFCLPHVACSILVLDFFIKSAHFLPWKKISQVPPPRFLECLLDDLDILVQHV